MKKYSLLLLMTAAFGIGAKAQTGYTTNPSPIIDGFESVTIHYHPYEAGDVAMENIDTAYVWTGVYEVPGTLGTWYGNPVASWGAVDGTAAVLCTKIDSDDYAFNIPNLRNFYSVPAGTQIDTIQIIFRSPDGNTQGSTFSIPVVEKTNNTPGQLIATTPDNLTWCNDSTFTVNFNPYNDTGNVFAAQQYENYQDTLYVYTWVRSSTPHVAADRPAVQWPNVGGNPALVATKIDSANYSWTVTNPNAFYGIGADTLIDSIGIIFRNSAGSTQTGNLFIVVGSCHTIGVNTVASNVSGVTLSPNPATSSVNVNYSFNETATTTVRIVNMVGQTVMTKELGKQQSGNVNVSLSGIPSGVYLVSVTNGTNKIVQRLIKD